MLSHLFTPLSFATLCPMNRSRSTIAEDVSISEMQLRGDEGERERRLPEDIEEKIHSCIRCCAYVFFFFLLDSNTTE